MQAALVTREGFADARAVLRRVAAKSIAPRENLTVSQWSDAKMHLTSKSGAKTGRWVTDNNPPLREPMDCMSARSSVQDVALMFPIQFGKSAVATNVIGYCMDHDPGPIMYALPGEVSMTKWINQKLNPMVEACDAVREALTSVSSRDSSNTRTFKDFLGGQLYVEHAGSPLRLKSTSVFRLIVDEVDEFAANLIGGGDPMKMLEGRTSAFPMNYKRLYISTPELLGVSRIHGLFMKGDQRRYHVPCPHCGEMQHLEWKGLHWSDGGKRAWYVCRENGCIIEEHHKRQMIAFGRWVAENPGAEIRSYHINCLYYQPDLGPSWAKLAEEWIDAQTDPEKLKTFVNDRLAEPWEDPAMRRAKFNIIKDRAEPYALRRAVASVLAVTAGVDTQDSRLAVHITGWGRGMASWTLDYVELPGDPEAGEVWNSLVELLSRPIEHEWGGVLHVLATAIDAGGHRTASVKDFVRARRITRPMCIFGSTQNNAPMLGKGKLEDVKASGKTDRRGLLVYQVGTVAIKHQLYARLSTDHDKQAADRLVHLSDDLDDFYFNGLVSEVYNPKKNRFEKKTGVRNEPLDTYTYSYAAALHPELRLHRHNRDDWDKRERELREMARPGAVQAATERLAAASRSRDEQDEPAPSLDGRRDPVPMPAPMPQSRSRSDDSDLFSPISMIG